MTENLLANLGLLVPIDAGAYSQKTLAAVVAGADVIAQRQLFPDLHKQLAGHTGTQDHIAYLHRNKVRAAIGNGGGKAHTEFALRHICSFGMFAGSAGAQSGLGQKGRIISGNIPEQEGQQLGNLLRLPVTHIEKLHPALGKERLIMGVKALWGNGGHILGFAQSGQAKGIAPAHFFDHLVCGIGTLIVALGFNGRDEVFLFAFHIVGAVASVLQHRLQKQLSQKIHHRLQQMLPFQGIAVGDKAAGKAGHLIVTGATHQRANGSAVQMVQSQGDAAQIRRSTAAPE